MTRKYNYQAVVKSWDIHKVKFESDVELSDTEQFAEAIGKAIDEYGDYEQDDMLSCELIIASPTAPHIKSGE